MTSDNITLVPGAGRVFVNGQQITDPTEIHQGFRIIVGMNHVFRCNHPAEAAKMRQERYVACMNSYETDEILQ